MPKGQIMKAVSGFYYVKDGGQMIQCRGRGNFRKRKVTPLVGDYVEYKAENETDGYILDVLGRKNSLVRPPVANIDIAIIVMSAVHPDFDPALLDRFLVHVEEQDISPVICLTKADLADESVKEHLGRFKKLYERIGYPCLLVDARSTEGVFALIAEIGDRFAIVAGQSGVGKSTLLNTLDEKLELETAAISKSLGRGRHTTRHTEFLKIGEGYIADTPGFSSLDLDTVEAENLSIDFPEFKARVGDCKFRGCLHVTEPGCAIKTAVNTGEIAESRYDSYRQFLDEIQSRKRRY